MDRSYSSEFKCTTVVMVPNVFLSEGQPSCDRSVQT